MRWPDSNWLRQLDAEAARRDRAQQWRASNPDLDRARAISDALTTEAVSVTESNTEAAWAEWDHAKEQLDRRTT